jgi:hypothetical protein
MRYPRFLIAVLALGAIGGFGAGFASLHHHRACCAGWHDGHDGRDHDGRDRDGRDTKASGEDEPASR